MVEFYCTDRSGFFVGREKMKQYIRVRRWAEQEANMDMKWGVSEPIETLYKELVIFTGETSVQYMYNERLHGVSKNNKHFFKFQTVRKVIYTIKPNAYGEMVGKFYLKEGKGFRNVTNNLYNALHGMTGRYSNSIVGTDVFAAQVRKVSQAHAINVDDTISIFDRAFTYPVLRHLEPGYEDGYPSAITRYAATNDLSVFVRRAFGKTRYRKDLVKAVANLTSVNVFMVGWSFRGLVPIDWIITFYKKYAKKNPRVFSNEVFLNDMRKILYKLPKKQLHKLFHLLSSEPNSMTGMAIRDIFTSLDAMYTNDLYKGVEDLKFTSLTEAHDKLATFVRVEQTKKRNAHFLEPLQLTDLAKQLLDIEYPDNADIRLKPAMCAMDLVEWGAQMGHCIGSYTHDAINQKGTFGAILQHGKVIGNFHYNNAYGSMGQIFGKHNQRLDNDILIAVFKLFVENTFVSYKNLLNVAGARMVYNDPRMLEMKKAFEKEEHDKRTVSYQVTAPEGAMANLAWQPLGHIDHHIVHNWAGGHNVVNVRQREIAIQQQARAEEIREYERFIAWQRDEQMRPRQFGQWGI